MKIIHFVASSFLVILCLISLNTFTNGTGAPAQTAAAPGEGNCTNCHGGSLITSGVDWGNLVISSNVPLAGYTPGASYTITVAHTMTGINKWGFQAVVLNSSNAQSGTTAAGSNSQSLLSGGKTYITHTGANTGTGGLSWTFNWIAPNPGNGNATVYATVNATNGNNATTGDQIFSKSLIIPQFSNNPTAIIGGIPSSNNVCIGDSLSLLGSGANSPTSFSWIFTGLPASSVQNPKILFTTPGQKQISLTTTNGFGSSSPAVVVVNVLNKPAVTFSPTGTVNICGNDSATLTVTQNAAFSYLWTPGNGTSSIFKTNTPGVYIGKVTSNTSGCATSSSPITVAQSAKPIPTLTLSKDTVCRNDSVLFTSSSPFTNYTFLNGLSVIQSGPQSTLKTQLSIGLKSIGLIVTNATGCKSDTIRKSLFVRDLLPEPIINCGLKTASSITFNWTAIPGASGYEISLDTGKTWSASSSNLSHIVTGLQPNKNVSIAVRAIDLVFCGKGLIGNAVCTNGACSPIVYSILYPSKQCIAQNVSQGSVLVQLSNIGISNFGIRYNNQPPTKDLSSMVPISNGLNSISIKIIDSLNIGCPTTDTLLKITGIVAPAKSIVSLSHPLCLGNDSAFTTANVSNLDNKAQKIMWFTNKDSIVPFRTTNLIPGQLKTSEQFKSNSPILANAQYLFVVSNDTLNGCKTESNRAPIVVKSAPLVGFTGTVDFLNLNLSDTTKAALTRTWIYNNVEIDSNAAATVVKTFPQKTLVKVRLITTDTSGCYNHAERSLGVFPVGLSELNEWNQYLVFPNPASQFIQVSNAFIGSELAIYNMAGQLLRNETSVGPMLNLDGFAPGIYYAQIVHNGVLLHQKFVKN